MLNFLNNGGIEWILATLYLGWVVIQMKIMDRKVQTRKPEKWHW